MVAERIVCLAAEIPEILFRLGALDRVVGVSAYTTRPPESLSIEKVSGFQHGSTKRIMATKPDLAILTSGVQRDLAQALAQEGVNLLHLNPHRLVDMFNHVELIGNLVGQLDGARQLVDEMRDTCEQIRAQALRLEWRPRVYFEEWMDPLMAGTGWVSDLIELAGGDDVFRSLSVTGRRAAERVVEKDQVVNAAPDIILASWCGKPFEPEHLTGRPGFDSIPAVRNGHVFEVSSQILQCGPMLMDSLQTIHQLIKDIVQ